MTARLFHAAALAILLVLSSAAHAKPLKVYILAGQSNMVGMATAKTLDHVKLDPESHQYFKDLFDENGEPVVMDDVYINYVGTTPSGEYEHGKLGPEWGARGRGPRIGPEYAFGVYMHHLLGEPILIIKPAWGGKSLSFDFRPPSAGTWQPPAGHPDLVTPAPPAPLPLPGKIDLPRDYVPGDDILPRYTTGRVGKYLGIPKFRGVAIGKQDGVHPIYIASGPNRELAGEPFKQGDLILGVDGQGLREDAIEQWRQAFYGSMGEGDWMITVTRWRDGRIETFDFDISERLEGGRAGIPAELAAQKKRDAEKEKFKGHYYRLMIKGVKDTLSDIKKVYPDYDESQGYELAGFVWFQGWNDMVNGGAYPNRNMPGGYDKYSWLLTHLIHDVRDELEAPELPFVIGVMGVEGPIADPRGSNQYYFRQAMAAPANDPQLKASVAAVYTEKYWPARLDALATRDALVRQQRNVYAMRDGLEGDELNEAYATYRAIYFTPEEETLLKTGKSNQGFHYLGSGKFMAGTGRAFAEAMMELHESE